MFSTVGSPESQLHLFLFGGEEELWTMKGTLEERVDQFIH